MVTEQDVIEAIKRVVDPHTGVNVYDMGLISELTIENDEIALTFIPTSPICPMGLQLAKDIKNKLCELEGVSECKVNVVGHVEAEEINKFLNQK